MIQKMLPLYNFSSFGGFFFFNKTVKVAYKVSIYVFWYVFIYDSAETNRDNRLSLD